VISAGDACKETVGDAGAGGAAGGATGVLATLLWQPAKKMTPLKIRITTFSFDVFIIMDSS
jgi:hypothetical protein